MHIPGGEFELLFGLTPSPPTGGGLLGKVPGILIGAEGGGALFPLAAGGAAVGAGFPEFCKPGYWEATVWRSDNAIGIADAIRFYTQDWPR
jgi:hypothetical protein